MATIPAPVQKVEPKVESAEKIATTSPEFQAAVNAAVETAMAKAVAAAQSLSSVSENTEEGKFAKILAMQLAQLTDQGTGRKRVAPEILEARHDAREEMKTLLRAAKKDGEVPVYSLVNKVYLDEVMVDPFWVGSDHISRKTEIEWPGVPNEAMRPVNEVAERIYDAFTRSIGSVVSVIPEDEFSVTAGGLTIKGRGNSRRTPHTGIENETAEGLRIHGRDNFGIPTEVRVLGTVAPAAQQRM